MSRSVFLSFAEPDRAYAKRIGALLRSHGVSAFMDSAMSPAANWKSDIAEKLAAADAVLVIVGASTHRSQLIDQEGHLARELGKPVIAVKIDPGHVLPPILYDVQATWTDLAGCSDAVARALDKLGTY